MILRIDHIALAVKDYEKAKSFFMKLFGAIPGTSAPDESMRYFWQNFSLGDLSRLELLTPTGPGSFLDKFLSDKEGGVHHITLQTKDIEKTREFLEKEKIPFFGFTDYGPIWKELFIHPRDSFGVLIQIAEFNPDDWLPPSVRMPDKKKWEIIKEKHGCTLKLKHPGGGCASFELDNDEINKLIEGLSSIKDKQ